MNLFDANRVSSGVADNIASGAICRGQTVRPEAATARAGAHANGEAGPKGDRQDDATNGELTEGMNAHAVHASIPQHERQAGSRTRGKPFASAIYEGWVRHRRFWPHPNAFRYRVCMLYLDLAELDRVFAGRWLWSRDRRNAAEFRRSDYFGDAGTSLDEAVRYRVACETGHVPRGPIRLLTHLRYFGVAFNPVSFYYCYAKDGVTLEAILAEITNTPWKERHAYVLPVNAAARHGGTLSWDFDKTFHVSPFVPMQRRYAWRFTAPAEQLHIHMEVLRTNDVDAEPTMQETRESARASALELDATLALERRALSGVNLARVLVRYPCMTAQIIAAIHWQALRIFVRGNPVYAHPKNQERSR